ncbi:MAG: hypothetical protein CBD72_04710 [Flavobacteriaceae bacterium TMED212]|nr:MAG: hypothetical protein CBD72_04710 [Flavobacteriaceae bacterium TMED212]|tara:strand:+ start:1462 stop:2427 length:966 start_codon:yes stop_codon:yes gene_type:complete
MKKTVFFIFISLSISCKKQKNNQRYLPDSSANINHLTVVMPEKSWKGLLGNKTRALLETPYEGLPFDEPQFTLKYIPPKVFTGFAKNSRNIIWFVKDTIARFQITENLIAQPQLVARVTGEDDEVQAYFLEENISLFKATLTEKERVEKRRRIKKSPTKDDNLQKRFNIGLVYPTAYKTVKDTTNFVWIQKEIPKGHMNLVAYTLPLKVMFGNVKKRILEIRDSIGKTFIPGRLKGSYMITEKAYRPYFYRTQKQGKRTYITKGTWEVANDFMAGPFINYMIRDTLRKRWMVIEGFTFAPASNKRDQMFELNTIIDAVAIE